MNRICGDGDFRNSWNIDSLVDTTFNEEEFSFSKGNVHHVVQSFDDRFVTDVNVSNGGCHIALDTSISNNNALVSIRTRSLISIK